MLSHSPHSGSFVMTSVRLLSKLMLSLFMLSIFAPVGSAEDLRIAVLEFPRKDREIEYVAKKWNKIILETIEKTDGYALADQKQLKKELKDRGIEPLEGHTILAVEAKQMGPIVGADLFVMGKVVPDGKQFKIDVRIIDANTGEERTSTLTEVTKKDDSIKAAASKLLAEIGSLQGDACNKYLKYAVDYEQAGQWEDAFANYEKMFAFCDSDTQKAYAYTQMGNICAQQRHDVQCAKENYQKAYEITKDWRTLAQLAVIYENENQPQLAIQTYEDVLKMIPADDIKSHADLSARIGMVYQERLKDAQHAIIWYETALDHDSEYDYAIDRLIRLYFENGQYAQAEAKMNKALKADPMKAGTWYPKFAAEYEEMAKSYCAFEGEGDCYNAANVTPQQRQDATAYYEKAISYYQKLIDITQSDHYYKVIGDIYRRMGRMDEALVAYRTFLKNNPDQTNLYCQIIFAMDDSPALRDQALAEARKMAAEYPDEACPYFIIGQHYQRMRVPEIKTSKDCEIQIGYYERAIEEYQKGLSKVTPDHWLYNTLKSSIENLKGPIEKLKVTKDELEWAGN
ncbi:MAG: hypothetical protein D6675_12005 [Gemmatimonadetes bacterium]|nr:MAG: hypothetical protein D6675_12005 [Gemmatimonadota bacterium]